MTECLGRAARAPQILPHARQEIAPSPFFEPAFWERVRRGDPGGRWQNEATNVLVVRARGKLEVLLFASKDDRDTVYLAVMMARGKLWRPSAYRPYADYWIKNKKVLEGNKKILVAG